MKIRIHSYAFWTVMSVLPLSLTARGQQASLNSLSMNLMPQLPTSGDSGGPILSTPSKTMMTEYVFAGKVMTLEGTPISGARVRIEPTNVSAEVRYLQTESQGVFYTEYYLGADYALGQKGLNVSLTVAKKGFLTARRYVEFGTNNRPKVIPITLLSVKEDPALLSRSDLIAILAPRLKKLSVADGLTAGQEQGYAKGAEEFLDLKRPERALPFFNKVVESDPSCLQCRTMLGLAQLDDDDWDGAYSTFAETVHAVLKDRTAGRPEPLIAAGVMQSWMHDPKKAAGFFAEALKFSPGDSLALQELGRSQLLLENWKVASVYLSKAVAAGAGPDARLMCAKALLGADDLDAADKLMTDFLGGRNIKTQPPRVREVWGEIRSRKEIVATYAKKRSPGDKPLDYLHGIQPELAGLEPAPSQLPLDSILRAAGENVAAYLRDFQNTSSLEEVHQEVLQGEGKKERDTNSQNQKFRYLCFTSAEAAGPGFREFRTDLKGTESYPRGANDGFMLTLGFVSASILFHPAYQSQSTFRYLGRQNLNGRTYDVVAFAQQPAKARFYAAFRMGQTSVTTLYQGLAWIDSESHQIVRLRTDLLKPLPQIELKKETTDIEYGAVQFKSAAAGFWLPQQVTVDVVWNGKHLRNQHHYSEYRLFNVEATEKTSNPKQAEPAAGAPNPPGNFH